MSSPSRLRSRCGGEPGPRIPGLLVHRGPKWFRAAQWWLIDRCLVDPAIGQWLFPFRERLGLPPVRGLFREWIHSPDRVLGMFPEWFASAGAELPAAWRFTGFPLFSEDGVSDVAVEVEQFVDAGPPPILFTPGSANVHGAEFFAAAADACRRLGRRGLLLTRFPEQIPTRRRSLLRDVTDTDSVSRCHIRTRRPSFFLPPWRIGPSRAPVSSLCIPIRPSPCPIRHFFYFLSRRPGGFGHTRRIDAVAAARPSRLGP